MGTGPPLLPLPGQNGAPRLRPAPTLQALHSALALTPPPACLPAATAVVRRAAAHLKPFNSGLLAGEALCAPFFGAARVSHAKLPVCAEQVFPRSGA